MYSMMLMIPLSSKMLLSSLFVCNPDLYDLFVVGWDE